MTEIQFAVVVSSSTIQCFDRLSMRPLWSLVAIRQQCD
jgi:hypothetical protein